MTNTIQRFSWKGRDAAARDLLQLVYHAPYNISQRALELMWAIRSPEIVPELLKIADSQEYFRWRGPLEAIAVTSGVGDLPEMEKYINRNDPTKFDIYGKVIFPFAAHNPSNLEWVFARIDRMKPSVQYSLLTSVLENRDVRLIHHLLYDRLITLLENYPRWLHIDNVKLLYKDERSNTRGWLAARWRDLVYLCITVHGRFEMYRLVEFLDNWTELRALVFYCCPSFIEDYIAYKRDREWAWGKEPPVDITRLALWRELSEVASSIDADDSSGFKKFDTLRLYLNRKNILQTALTIQFMARLPNTADFTSLEFYVRGGLHYPWEIPKQYRTAFVYEYPLFFEAGELLREYHTPHRWEKFIEEYLARTTYFHLHHLSDWIAYQTDVLSDIDAPYSGLTWDVGQRPWFRALVEQEAEQTDWTETVPPLWTHPTAALSFGVE